MNNTNKKLMTIDELCKARPGSFMEFVRKQEQEAKEAWDRTRERIRQAREKKKQI